MNPSPSDEKIWDSFTGMPDAIKLLVSENAFAFPGMINAHDHLEFNLFPTLANRVYRDYMEWGQDIHIQQKETIERIERIPADERIRFGIVKNLVNGFTGVVHHGRHHALIQSLSHYPVGLNYQYMHALATEPLWKAKLNLPFTSDLMMHLGEGTSDIAQSEIDRLIRSNWINKPVIGIHAIGITPQQACKFKAIIWCPDSNMLLYNKTIPVNTIKDRVTVLFGTDSTVSSNANAWEQLRVARRLNLVSDADLFNMLCDEGPFHGLKQPGDWVVVRRKKALRWESFFDLNPADILLVTLRGAPWLCDDSLPNSYRPRHSVGILVGGVLKWVEKDLGECVASLKRYDVELPLSIQPR